VQDVVVETVAVVFGAAAVSGLAGRLRIPAPIALVLAGVVVSGLGAVPGGSAVDLHLDPDLVLLVFLPPLLYSAALESSYVNLRRNLRPILQLAVGHVVFTTVVAAWVVHWLTGLPWAVSFVVGAVVSPPDAVAATALGRALGMPRRGLTILGGESLLNDATALTLFRLGVAAAAGTLSVGRGTLTFLLASAGGVVLGLVLAAPIHRVRVRLREPVLENALALIVPFAAYVLAESVGASGVLTVVVLGLYLGHREVQTTFAARLQARAVWQMLDFLLESVVFLLIGIQAVPIVRGALADHGPAELVGYGVAVLATVIAARFVWIFATTYPPRWLSRRLRERGPAPSWQEAVVLSWAGMRGVVSLAAALAIPAGAVTGGQRALVLYLTMCVVLGTLVVHGLTLPAVMRRLGVVGREQYDDVLAEAAVQHAAARAAVDRLDELVREADELPDGVDERLRRLAEYRANSAWERLGGETPEETPAQAFRRLRREMVDAERETFVRMRDQGRIDDEVLRRVMTELDLEEAMLARD
jgi:CPA1 family monovalent cation:H+ antiporter